MDNPLTPEIQNAILEDALHTYPVAQIPRDITMDVMSRIQYAIEHRDGLEKLHKAIIGTLNKLLKQAAKAAGIQTEEILEKVLVGNSTKHHLLLNLPPKDLGLAPVVPPPHSPPPA